MIWSPEDESYNFHGLPEDKNKSGLSFKWIPVWPVNYLYSLHLRKATMNFAYFQWTCTCTHIHTAVYLHGAGLFTLCVCSTQVFFHFKELSSTYREIGFSELGGFVKPVGLQQSGPMGMEENCPGLIWPLENLRRVVSVIDNCVWLECGVSVDNDFPNQTSESAHRRSTVEHCVPTVPCSWLGLGVHAQDAYHCPQQPAPSAIMLCWRIMTSPSASTVSSFYTENMPDGDNWRKVIGQWRCNSFHSEMAPGSRSSQSWFPEGETAARFHRDTWGIQFVQETPGKDISEVFPDAT